MHIYFSGIGGAAISALAVIAKQSGYEVSGSDARNSQYLDYLRKKGITNIHVGLERKLIEQVHKKKTIDWFVYGSAQPLDFPDNPEFKFVEENNIKKSKRDELLNEILSQNNLKLIAIAGTHGKTTTTSMTIWLFKQLKIPISYSVGAKISFGDMGHFDPKSKYFVYEGDEFDRNFLAFKPHLANITGIAWDHHEIYPTKKEYLDAFRQFLKQSKWKVLWNKDKELLGINPDESYMVLDDKNPAINELELLGWHNRADAWQVIRAAHELTKEPIDNLVQLMNGFPGVSRRFEKITENLYTDYAHTPEKIIGAMGTAKEATENTGQKIAVIYEPLTNRRMHYTRKHHKDIFEGASAIYWVPSFLAREDPNQAVLSPRELISNLSPELRRIAHHMELNQKLKMAIRQHLARGDLVIAMSGGGAGSLDEWLRKEFGKG